MNIESLNQNKFRPPDHSLEKHGGASTFFNISIFYDDCYNLYNVKH